MFTRTIEWKEAGSSVREITHPTACFTRSPSKVKKGDAGIWQRRFWEHHIRNKADCEAHIRHCWLNPVKHGLVKRPEDWPYSSVHRDIAEGRYAAA